MVEAISTLDEPLSQAISWSMVKLEALRLARNGVKEDIRAKGLSLKDYEAKEITELAMALLDNHRAELIGKATIGLSHAQKKAYKSLASAVQIASAQTGRPWTYSNRR